MPPLLVIGDAASHKAVYVPHTICHDESMTTRIVIVRDQPVRDLIFLAREAADVVRTIPGFEALADALNGSSAEVARELNLAPVDPSPASV